MATAESSKKVDIELWRSIILDARSRAHARKKLDCTFAELKAFRAVHMPEHQWPEPRTSYLLQQDDDLTQKIREERKKYLSEQVKRDAEGKRRHEAYIAEKQRPPTSEEVDAAILMLNPRQMQAMVEFMPGMHPKNTELVHEQLAERNLIWWKARSNFMSGDWVLTGLGRAAQEKLKQLSTHLAVRL